MTRRTFVGGTLAALALTLVVAGATAAQEDDQPVAVDSPPALFLRMVEPEDDLEVPLSTSLVTLRGETLPGAIVSVDGALVDVDDAGGFAATLPLDLGPNAIDIVASTDDGSTTDTTILVIRGTD